MGTQKSFLRIHVFTCVLSILILTAGIFWYVSQQSKNTRTEYLANQLNIIATMKADQVSLLIQGKRDRVVDFSSDGKIKETLLALKENRGGTTTAQILIDHLITNKLPTDSSFYEVYAMDLSGTVIASTNKVNVGTSLSHDTIYTIGKERPYVKNIAYDTLAKVPYFNVSAPVMMNGKGAVGVIAIKMLADSVNTIMLRNPSDIEIESYIINNERYLVTPSKYLGGGNKGVLAQMIDTKNAFACTNAIKNNKNASIATGKNEYVNYAGVRTLGTYQIIEDLKWCVLVETEL